MEWKELAKELEIEEEAIGQMEELPIDEDAYVSFKMLYRENHEDFFEEVKKRANAPLWFLALYCRFACDTYEEYHEFGIADEVFWDTFQDIRLWCENHKTEYGTYGIGVYFWLWRHIDMTILRLGRLQFEEMVTAEDVGVGKDRILKGTPVMNIHIPQGEKLYIEACKDSLLRAYEVYGKGKPYVCHSWLLFPGLCEVLEESSNIMQFQSLFRIIRTDYEDREAEWRVFGSIEKCIKEYPENTSLQRRLKEQLLKGCAFGSGFGIIS